MSSTDNPAQKMPKTTKCWTVEGQKGFESLTYNESREVPALGASEVLVKIQGMSLNYRDLIIPKGKYPFGVADSVVPGSDGAGVVVEVGEQVTRFQPGDKVITLFNQGHLGGSLDQKTIQTGLGGVVHGTLREYGSFNENGLVAMPEGLSFVEAATLSCAGLTAWNALYGLETKALKAGDWVLTQGTGGVSIFALQFAKASGARVIATTGSDDKAETLKKLGADHVINYKTNPKWGDEAKKITGGEGVDHVLEVAGPNSMAQSIASIKMDGVISIIGFLGGPNKTGDEPGFLQCLNNLCTVRGILVGSRVQFEDMNRAISANVEKLRPVVDKEVFTLERAKEAYEYMWAQRHFGKVCLKCE